MTQMTAQAIEPAVRAWTRLLRAYASTTRLLSAELQEEHGLTINDYEALLVLSRAEDGRMKRVALARSLLLTPSGITRLLQGLEDAGLVERASCATDRRVTYAHLTDAGRDKLEGASGGHVASIRTLFEEHFAHDEIDAIAEILGKLPGVAEGDDSCSPG
jgi:MarR family 2-MHQ and catechol resistance regulon transcriptional repressor